MWWGCSRGQGRQSWRLQRGTQQSAAACPARAMQAAPQARHPSKLPKQGIHASTLGSTRPHIHLHTSACPPAPPVADPRPSVVTTTISSAAVSMAGMPVCPGWSERGRLTTAAGEAGQARVGCRPEQGTVGRQRHV